MHKVALALAHILPLFALAEQPERLPEPRLTKDKAKAPPKVQPPPPPIEAGPVELIGPESARYMAMYKVRNVPRGTAVIWDIYPEDSDTTTYIVKVEKACVVSGPPREYTIKVRLVKGEEVTEFKRVFVLTHGARPPPVPVDPVTPQPKPVDPTAPIPELGFRVLVVYQDTDLNKYSASQRGVLFGKDVREYLEAKCVLGPDGKTKEYRIWDNEIEGVENESTLWQKAFARPHPLTTTVTDTAGNRKIVPAIWLVVSNGKEGWEGPIPPTMTTAEVLALLKKYGG